MNEYLEFAKQLAVTAGEITLKHFGFKTAAEWKEDNTPLTIADTTINKMVIDRVRETFADHGVLGEEESYEESRDKLWVVDPIDGTQPFSVGAPLSAFSIAYVEAGVVQVGVVYDPYQNRLFSAVRGQGAELNGKPIKTQKLPLKYVAITRTPKTGFKSSGQVVDACEVAGLKTFNFRSYVYGAVLVAVGTIQAAILGAPKPWDVAACSLIVEEAGGRASSLSGEVVGYNENEHGVLLTNGDAHEQLLSIVKA